MEVSQLVWSDIWYSCAIAYFGEFFGYCITSVWDSIDCCKHVLVLYVCCIWFELALYGHFLAFGEALYEFWCDWYLAY